LPEEGKKVTAAEVVQLTGNFSENGENGSDEKPVEE